MGRNGLPLTADAPSPRQQLTAGGRAPGAPDLAPKIAQWREQLLDLSKRNRLINCHLGKAGALELAHPSADAIWQHAIIKSGAMSFPSKAELLGIEEAETPEHTEGASPAPDAAPRLSEEDKLTRCLISDRLKPTHLLTPPSDAALVGKLTRLSIAAKTSLSEQGVNSLFLAFGLLRWFESNASDAPPLLSPLVLVPVTLKRPGADADWRIDAVEDEVVENHSLGELLRSQYSISLPPLDEDQLLLDPGALGDYLRAVREAIGERPRWEVDQRALLGIFAFQKLAMWHDLGRNGERIAEHAVCRAIGGDRNALDETALTAGAAPAASELDELAPPQATHHILDCDSSQQLAIEQVKRGSHLVLDGPPGTGKSQTIANVIAECLARGQTVLFVSEKAAALEVVKRRLDRAGLGAFCLECHSHKASKKQVVAELGRSLNLAPDQQFASQDEQLDELHRLRGELNGYVRALHASRFALQRSAYHVHGQVAGLASAPATRCAIGNAREIDAAKLADMTRAIEAMAQLGHVLVASANHPWRGVRAGNWSLALEDDIRHFFSQASVLLRVRLAAFEPLRVLGFTRPDPTLADLEELLAEARWAITLPEIPAQWFERDGKRVATGYLELDRLAQRFAGTRATLRAYRTAAITQHDPAIFARAAINDPFVHRAKSPQAASTVRTSRQHLDTLADELKRVNDVAGQFQAAVERLGALLQLADGPEMSIDSTGQLVAAATIVSQLGLTRAVWFDGGRRRELRPRAERLADERRAIAAERAELEKTFAAPAAFAPEAANVARDVLGNAALLKRLFPAWRRAREAMLPLYRDPAPKSVAVLRQDAHRLVAHLARVASFEKSRHALAAELDLADPTLDLEHVADELARIDQLAALIAIPQQLAALLGIEGALDRSACAAAAADVKAAAEALQRALAELGEQYRLDVDPGGRIEVLTPRDARAFLSRAETALRERGASLDALATWLEEDADVPVGSLPIHARLLRELSEMLATARQIAPSVTPWETIGDELTSEQFRSQALLAAALLDALPANKWPVGAHVIRVMSDADVRQQTASGIETAAAARDVPELNQSLEFVYQLFDAHTEVSTGVVLEKMPVTQLSAWLDARSRDVPALQDWLHFLAAKSRMESMGLSELLREMAAGTIPSQSAAAAIQKRFYREWLDAAWGDEPALAEFRLESHETTIGRFRELDRQIIARTHERVRAAQLQDAGAVRDPANAADVPESSERGVLLREVNKRRRHLPLRQLFKQIPNLLTRLKPCVMMSPLAVSTFFESDQIDFDVVIFDEASQVRPHDAIGAIYRGRQLLVAGDQKQMPPTSFFERIGGIVDSADGEEPPAETTADFESILDVCATLPIPRRRLKWHYRSRRESLIAFSNRHFYDDELVTFPSSRDIHNAGDGNGDCESEGGVRLEYVSAGRWRGGTAGGGTNPIEARRAAELVIEHASRSPQLSLGVVTMNQPQQLLLHELIEKLRREAKDRQALDAFFSEDRTEPFFVKNLENVQGDERDVMLLCVSYARGEESGTLSHNFGPLNQSGGERRLNVAVTRAREQMIVVSSIRAEDIDVSRTQARGATLLRAYLQFAERGPGVLEPPSREASPGADDFAFEKEVAEALRREGFEVREQIGCGGMRIPIALLDPAQAQRFVLGIEGDGPTYRAAATARDRDRLRKEVLEKLGWTIVRVWSTDWVRDPNRQIARIREAYELARKPDALVEPASTISEPAIAESAIPEPVAPVQTDAPAKPQAAAPKRATPTYDSIDDVPVDTIDQLLLELLAQNGATPTSDLRKATAKRLGFSRTGNRISTRLNERVAELQKRGRIRADEGGRLLVD